MPLRRKKNPNSRKEPALLLSETAAAAAKGGFSVSQRILKLRQGSLLLNDKGNNPDDHYIFQHILAA